MTVRVRADDLVWLSCHLVDISYCPRTVGKGRNNLKLGALKIYEHDSIL